MHAIDSYLFRFALGAGCGITAAACCRQCRHPYRSTLLTAFVSATFWGLLCGVAMTAAHSFSLGASFERILQTLVSMSVMMLQESVRVSGIPSIVTGLLALHLLRRSWKLPPRSPPPPLPQVEIRDGR